MLWYSKTATMADEVKQVKVDNWGIYFLQRLKHFFNRTDYCDLTLQFQDNAQLKVHRLVLSACTEYFELLERTCEMYEDCLVMPEDLQADVVVPIVNFMYTGQLEFKMELLERLYQCSEIMNMPVLTKLLDSHRPKMPLMSKIYTPPKKGIKRVDGVKEIVKSISATEIVTTSPITYKRSHKNAFEKTTVYRDKRVYLPINKPANNGIHTYREPSPIPLDQRFNKKVVSGEPRPTRYELPEELDTDNIFENSFCDISYTSQPLIVHPETTKKYGKRPKLSNEPSTSKSFSVSTVDIVPCSKPIKLQEDSLFQDTILPDDSDTYTEHFTNNKPGSSKDTNQLFDQILEKPDDTKVTIEAKNSKSSGNLDHAKIISEVLKRYPHLVKSNKNIKLKILNTPTQSKNVKKQKQTEVLPKAIKTERDVDFTFETDVLDSIQAAKLIALGAENIDGPWICLICGTPGKAMNFTSYYKFRRHLVEVHNEKPVLNICEYCGQKSIKRNYLLHHMYTKHGVEPPPSYRFPKCNQCSYIALSEAMLVKHKMSHSEVKKFRCNVCPAAFHSSNLLLAHIQTTGHKYSTERKTNYQCIYCQRVFLRETNLCAHLKTHHRFAAIQDGIIDDSDEEQCEEKKNIVKSEINSNDFQDMDIQYQIQQRADGNINIVTKTSEPSTSSKQTILNAGLSSIQGQSVMTPKNKSPKKLHPAQSDYIHDMNMTSNDTLEEIVMIDNTEYIMRDNQLIPRRPKPVAEEYILSDDLQSMEPTTSMEFTNIQNSNVQENMQHANMILKNPGNLAESIPIYVSNEEEYKALMASNQPIIFDSGDSNKTLTVLTAPHTSTLDTSNIDLNNTQANDMMIIQDNYPLNATDAVASENSNIVVVYSHPVDGQSKQYQLLNTQGLGAQFVQSSAIITQNFGTITTTAPIMNTQVLDKQVQEVWPSNLDQIVNSEHIEITPVSHPIQEQTNQIEPPKTLECTNDISELPEVELSSNTETVASNDVDIPSANQGQNNMVEAEVIMDNDLDKNTEVECENNAQSMSIMEENEDVPTEHAVEETVDSNEQTDNPDENVIAQEDTDPKKDPVQEDPTLMESQTYTQPDNIEPQEYSQADPNVEPAVENMDITDQQEPLQVAKNIQPTAEIEINEEQLDSVTDACLVSDNTEQIISDDNTEIPQNMNSEWAEELVQETPQEIPAEMTSLDDNTAQIINQQSSLESCELEESIENIQQEVDKQISAETSVQQEITDEVSDVANSSQDESDYVQENTVTVPVNPAEAQEKITSLLNDWEDNDSQEGTESTNENAHIEENVADEAIENTVPADTENPEKQDKIKSLVSDWDEDEEEKE